MLLATAGILNAAAADLSVAVGGSRPTEWTINYEGKPLMVYAFDPQRFKP